MLDKIPNTEVVLELDSPELPVLPLRRLDELLAGNQGSFLVLPEKERAFTDVAEGKLFRFGGEILFQDVVDHPVKRRAVYLHSVRDAYFFPKEGVVISQDGHAFNDPMQEAAYFSPDLSKLPHMSKTGGNTIFTIPEHIDRLAQVAVTMPMGGTGNYGHFVLDCLPGIAVLRSLGMPSNFEYVFPPLKPWHIPHLEMQGVNPVVLDKDVYLVDHVLFTSCLHHNLHWPSEHFLDINRGTDNPSPERKIYLSRSQQKRTFISEPRLEEALAAIGFEIVAPESHSIQEQIDLFKNAKVVVGAAGANLTNVLYCSPGAEVIEIQPYGMHNVWVRNLALLLELNWSVYFCRSNHIDGQDAAAGLEFDVNVDEVVKFIEAGRYTDVLGSTETTNNPGDRP